MIFWIIYLCLSSSIKMFFLKARYSFLISATKRLFCFDEGSFTIVGFFCVKPGITEVRLDTFYSSFFPNKSNLEVFWSKGWFSSSVVWLRAVNYSEECTLERELLNILSTDSDRSLVAGTNLVGSLYWSPLSIRLSLLAVFPTYFHLKCLVDIDLKLAEYFFYLIYSMSNSITELYLCLLSRDLVCIYR